MPTTTTTRPLFEQIDSWLKEIESTKTASARPASSKQPTQKKAGVKKAGPPDMGETTHPSKDVDGNTQPEEVGSRYEENTADVEKDIPDSVDSTDPKGGGDQDDSQMNIGTHQSAVGEDPAVEEDYKGYKEDPGTSSPANAEEIGEKYSSMHLKKLLKIAEDKAHSILADLANGVMAGHGQSVQQKAAAVKAAQPANTETKTAATAGYDVSAATVEMEKAATEFIAQTIRDADIDADLVGSFIHSYYQSRVKKAADESDDGEDHKERNDGRDDGGDDASPADAGSDAGTAPPSSNGADVLSALGASAGGPPDADTGGGAPTDADYSGMSQEQALQELAMALEELGITPDELAQMAQIAQQNNDAGSPPPALAAEGAKLASAVKRFKRAGKFKVEEAKTAAQRQARDQIKDYIREITGNKL